MAVCSSELMGFAEKLDMELGRKGKSQAALARLTGVAQTTISALTRGVQKPSLEQAFKLAKGLGLSLDYLADDSLVEPPRPVELADDERSILKLYRALRLSEDEALRRLAGEPTTRGATGGVAKVVGEADLSERARAHEEREKRRLGFELEADCEAVNPEDGPVSRQRR